MFNAQDIVDNSITLFFPSECEWCSLYPSDFAEIFKTTKSCSFGFLIKEITINPPYLVFKTWEAVDNTEIVEAHIFYKDTVLDTDVQFAFDSTIGIPFMSALQDLWLRNLSELKQEKAND